jgi:hypothetical protein
VGSADASGSGASRRARVAAAALLLAVRAGAGADGAERILEARDVQHLKVEETRSASGTRLRIQGLVFHSALGVERTATAIQGGRLEVLVHLALARPGVPGNLDLDLEIPDAVHAVVFGKAAVVVWRRGREPIR